MTRRLSELVLQVALWLGTLAAAAVFLVAVGATLRVLWEAFKFGWRLL